MPRLKQVDSLKDMANRVLLNSVVQCCRRLCATGTLIEIRNGISDIKEAILKFDTLAPNQSRSAEKSSMTSSSSVLSADFAARYINDCNSFVRDEYDGIALLEMIMDVEIVGLRLTGPILRFLRPYTARHFRGLKELDLSHAWSMVDGMHEGPPMNLVHFRLDDLTSLTYPKHCTDSDLKIVGIMCPNLEILDLHDSENVTDDGLGYLSPCSNLRVLRVDRCPKVTHIGLSIVLSVHEKLEEFSYGYNVWPKWSFVDRCYHVKVAPATFDMMSGLDSSPQCRSLTRFVYQNRLDISDFDLETGPSAIVRKFPNLTHLKILCTNVENLSSVKHLTKLVELIVNFSSGRILIDERDTRRTWISLTEALSGIGTNLHQLALCSWQQRSPLTQIDMDFIYEKCPNLKYLQFDEASPLQSIPPFRKLKVLIIRSLTTDLIFRSGYEFGNMLNLEILYLLGTHMKAEVFESMMWDNVKFPKLKVVETDYLDLNDLARIQQIAKSNNLDFVIHNEKIKGDVHVIQL